jgi:hypothetical protein
LVAEVRFGGRTLDQPVADGLQFGGDRSQQRHPHGRSSQVTAAVHFRGGADGCVDSLTRHLPRMPAVAA